MKVYTDELDMIIESKIKPNLKRIYSMKIRGLTDRQISKALGISVRHFEQAVENYSALKEAYDSATQLLCTELRQVVIERALGQDGKMDKDGNLVGPDPNLAFRMLEKFDPAFKKDKTEVNVTMTIEHVIHELNQKRRLEEKKHRELEEEAKEKGYDA